MSLFFSLETVALRRTHIMYSKLLYFAFFFMQQHHFYYKFICKLEN